MTWLPGDESFQLNTGGLLWRGWGNCYSEFGPHAVDHSIQFFVIPRENFPLRIDSAPKYDEIGPDGLKGLNNPVDRFRHEKASVS
jgi:hypothetical protein